MESLDFGRFRKCLLPYHLKIVNAIFMPDYNLVLTGTYPLLQLKILFLKKLEIEKTKYTFIISVLKVEY